MEEFVEYHKCDLDNFENTFVSDVIPGEDVKQHAEECRLKTSPSPEKQRLLPVDALRQRMREKAETAKTGLEWLQKIGVKDETAFIWAFVSAVVLFYLRLPQFFALVGICIFVAWFWKKMTPQKEIFVGVFAAFVFFSVFSSIFSITPYASRQVYMRGPVSTFSCQEMKNGNYECQFSPQHQRQRQRYQVGQFDSDRHFGHPNRRRDKKK